jgi:hypothetical protein
VTVDGKPHAAREDGVVEIATEAGKTYRVQVS